MGLFSDTIHDARRPIAGGWVRRAAADEGEPSLPEEDFAQEGMPSGMQTVFRFQKEGQGLPREASFQFGGGSNRLPAGDPLSAGTEVERPEPPATNVQVTDISVKGDNRRSELATGQVIHGSPGKVAAANVKSESKTHQSEGLPGPIEAEWVRETHQSNTPEGGERLVSVRGETFLSRPPGRGAPSEPSSAVSTPPRDTGSGVQPAQGAANAVAVAMAALPDTAAAIADRTPSRAREFAAPPREALPATAAYASALPPRRGRAAFAAAPDPQRAAEAGQPSLVIGRIDVVVVANAAPPQPQPAAHSDRGFLSRNYLKRL